MPNWDMGYVGCRRMLGEAGVTVRGGIIEMDCCVHAFECVYATRTTKGHKQNTGSEL